MITRFTSDSPCTPDYPIAHCHPKHFGFTLPITPFEISFHQFCLRRLQLNNNISIFSPSLIPGYCQKLATHRFHPPTTHFRFLPLITTELLNSHLIKATLRYQRLLRFTLPISPYQASISNDLFRITSNKSIFHLIRGDSQWRRCYGGSACHSSFCSSQ